jgi:para-nitrobenzyl esterase
MSICVLLGSPLADGLFHRAIVESGGGCNGYEEPDVAYPGRASMFDRGAALVTAVGCGDAVDELACLRGIADPYDIERERETSLSILATLPASVEYAPNVDGVLLTEDPFQRVAHGRGPDVPVIIGSNADEAYAFTLDTVILTETAYENAVTDLFGDAAPGVLAAYPASDFARPKEAYNVLLSDVGFVCPTLSFAEAASGGAAPSFAYHLTRTLTGPLSVAGAYHGLELMYVFGNFGATYDPTPEDMALVYHVQRAWTGFARSGQPDTVPIWPPFDALAPAIMILDEPLQVKDDIREGRCAALRALGLVPSP